MFLGGRIRAQFSFQTNVFCHYYDDSYLVISQSIPRDTHLSVTCYTLDNKVSPPVQGLDTQVLFTAHPSKHKTFV